MQLGNIGEKQNEKAIQKTGKEENVQGSKNMRDANKAVLVNLGVKWIC